jgi:hypothetical protein
VPNLKCFTRSKQLLGSLPLAFALPVEIVLFAYALPPRGQGKMQNLTGESLKVVWTEFSTLSQAVFIVIAIQRHTQARPHLKVKTRPRFCPASLSLSTPCWKRHQYKQAFIDIISCYTGLWQLL